MFKTIHLLSHKQTGGFLAEGYYETLNYKVWLVISLNIFPKQILQTTRDIKFWNVMQVKTRMLALHIIKITSNETVYKITINLALKPIVAFFFFFFTISQFKIHTCRFHSFSSNTTLTSSKWLPRIIQLRYCQQLRHG